MSKGENDRDLKKRTYEFALAVLEFVSKLPKTDIARTIGGQLLRSGTSVGANYRASCRARSTADFISKMGIVEEEADECIYWMELLVASKIVKEEELLPLINEANELVSIAVSSIKTARNRTK